RVDSDRPDGGGDDVRSGAERVRHHRASPGHTERVLRPGAAGVSELVDSDARTAILARARRAAIPRGWLRGRTRLGSGHSLGAAARPVTSGAAAADGSLRKRPALRGASALVAQSQVETRTFEQFV